MSGLRQNTREFIARPGDRRGTAPLTLPSPLGGARVKNRRSAIAFTVIELMLAVAIMGVIIYALYSVFSQTQRALRRSETGVDVAQRARAVMEMVGREIEQAQPTFGFWPSTTSTGLVFLWEINMMGGLEYPPRVQASSERTDIQPRTNFLHNIFFYNNKTNAWQAIGYRVIYVTNGVGVLQRFETNQFGYRPISNRLATAFINEPQTNITYHHIADGVIHLTFVPYDLQGQRLGWDTDNSDTNHYTIIRQRSNGDVIEDFSDTNVVEKASAELREAFPVPVLSTNYTTAFRFKSNALPAYIEMELGILEPEALEQYYLMVEEQNANAADFLERQINKVHLFRQRIPIRAAAQ